LEREIPWNGKPKGQKTTRSGWPVFGTKGEGKKKGKEKI